MGKPTSGGYYYNWNPTDRTIEIKTKQPGAPSATGEFGLGNATFNLNLADLATEEITMAITDETTGEGLIPPSPFGLKRWRAGVVGSTVAKTLTGANDWSKIIQYFEADDFKIEQAAAGAVTQQNYGKTFIGTGERL